MTNTDKNRADFEAWLPPYDPLPIIKERMLEAYRAGREAERAESVNHNHLLERVAAVEKELSAKYSGNSVHDMLRQWYTNTVPGRPTLNILRLTRIITEYIKERAEAVTYAEAVAWGIIARNTGRMSSVTMDKNEADEFDPQHIVPLYKNRPEPSPDVGPVAYQWKHYDAMSGRPVWRVNRVHNGSTSNERRPLYTCAPALEVEAVLRRARNAILTGFDTVGAIAALDVILSKPEGE